MNPMAGHPTFASIAALLCCALAAGCSGDTGNAPPVPRSTPVAAVETSPPEYPLALACAGVGGQSVLQVTVGEEGSPTRIVLTRGSGNDELDRLAREAVQGWKFRAATRAGQAVPQVIQVPVNFTAPAVRPDACFALDAGRAP